MNDPCSYPPTRYELKWPSLPAARHSDAPRAHIPSFFSKLSILFVLFHDLFLLRTSGTTVRHHRALVGSPAVVNDDNRLVATGVRIEPHRQLAERATIDAFRNLLLNISVDIAQLGLQILHGRKVRSSAQILVVVFLGQVLAYLRRFLDAEVDVADVALDVGMQVDVAANVVEELEQELVGYDGLLVGAEWEEGSNRADAAGEWCLFMLAQ